MRRWIAALALPLAAASARAGISLTAASSQYLENTAAAVTAMPLTIGCRTYITGVGDYTALSIDNGTTADHWYRIGITAAASAMCNSGSSLAAQKTAFVGGLVGSSWQTLVGVFNSATDLTCYLDNGSGTSASSVTPGTVNRTHVGVLELNTTGKIQYWNGLLADCAAWEVALTAGDVASYTAGASPMMVRPEGLVGVWTLNQRADPEPDFVGGFALTRSGVLTAADHPRHYMRAQPWSFWDYHSAGGGGACIPCFQQHYRQQFPMHHLDLEAIPCVGCPSH